MQKRLKIVYIYVYLEKISSGTCFVLKFVLRKSGASRLRLHITYLPIHCSEKEKKYIGR